MTITTEEAEWLAKQHDLVRFTLGMKAPEHDLTAATIRSLAAERDALKAENARLREGLREIRNKARTGRPPFMSTKTDYFQIASAGLGETQ